MADPKEAELSKEELDNKKRLTQQSLLLLNLYDLSALNRNVFTKGDDKRYKNFVCLEDDDPSIMMTRLMGVNMLNPSRLKTHHFSSLVPEMRFFKKTKDKISEIIFPTHAGVDQKGRYGASLDASFASLVSSVPNMGVRSLDWSFQGATAHMEKSSLLLNVQIYAERISDLFTQVVGQDDPKLKYSDLFTLSSKYKLDEKGSTKAKEENPDFFSLQMQVGWSITEELTTAFEPEVKKALKLLKDQKTLMNLSLVNFDFDFGQEGSVVMNLSYKSYLESMFNSPYHSNILFSAKELENQNAIRKEIKKLEKKVKQAEDKMEEEATQKAVKKTNEKIEEKQKEITELQSDRAARYSSIVQDLLLQNKVRIYTVSESNILYRYQYQDAERDLKDFRESCSKNSSPENIPGYIYVSSLPMPHSEHGSSGDHQMSAAHIKIYLKKDSPLEKFYTYHESNLSPAKKDVYRGQRGDGMIPHKDLKSLMMNPGHTVIDSESLSNFATQVANEIASNPIDKPQCTTKEMDSHAAAEANRRVQLAVQAGKEEDERVEDLKVAFDKLAEPEFKDDSYNIKYFFLGDLLDIAIARLKAKNPEKWKDIRVVVGSAEFSTFSTAGQMEGFYDANLKDGVVSINRTAAADKKVAAAAQSAGKEYQEISRDMKRYYRNLADVPIALSTFLSWFDREYVSKNVTNMPLSAFIQGLMKMAIKSLSVIDDEFALLPKQDVLIQKTLLSVPQEVEGEDYFKFDNKTGKIKAEDGRLLFSEIRDKAVKKVDGDKLTPEGGSNGMSLREAKLRGTIGNKDVTNYLVLHAASRSLPPERRINFVQDSVDGIPHFFVGGNEGLMKSINFSLVPNKMMETDAMLRDTNKFNEPRFPIKGRYDVELTLFGNTFFTPGTVICINPSALRLGDVKNPDSPINALGIAGYYNVVKVASYIQNGTYETKINCRFLSPGNGYSATGKHMTKLPTREMLDKKKRKA